MRLCERLNLSPDELAAVPVHKVLDWLSVMRHEAEVAKK